MLKECSVVLCEDTRVSKQLINLLNDRFSAGINISKFISVHSHNEADFISTISPSFFDENVAYMSDAGMPGVSDPGALLVEYCLKNGIKYEVLAGANAALVGLVSSGLCQKEFVFLGFLPNTGKEREIAIQNALNAPYPTVIYESPRRIVSLVDSISKTAPDRAIHLAKELSKKFERHFSGNALSILDELKTANTDGEWVVTIAPSNHASKVERISVADINELSISAKQKAKLIAKITGRPVKEVYGSLVNEK